MVGGVELVDDSLPVGDAVDGDHAEADGLGLRVVGGELDAELSHHLGRGAFAGVGDGEREVVEEDLALLGDGGRGGGLAFEHLTGLAEDPGVTDAASGDSDGGDGRLRLPGCSARAGAGPAGWGGLVVADDVEAVCEDGNAAVADGSG